MQKDKIKQTCLYYAARESKYLCCKYLCEIGVPVNELDFYLQTPIYYAAREGATKICELLISYGADVNVEDKYGQICLFYSIKMGHILTTEFLIKSGANVNKVDNKKLTPYLCSIKNNHPEIAELLVKYNASSDQVQTKKPKKVKEEDKTTDILPKEFKYILIKINDEGKSRLSNEELHLFEQKHKEIYDILNNKEKLQELEMECDERLMNTEGWEKVCKKILNLLWKTKDASLFHKPVDAIELGIPDYHNIIKNPMDFSTIKKKLSSGYYVNFSEFNHDINLVFNNCLLYNGDKGIVGNICLKIKEEWSKLYEVYNLGLFL